MNWDAQTEINQWGRDLTRLPQLLQDAAKQTNDKSANDMARRLKRNVPTGPDTPHLKDTIKIVDGDASKFEKIVSIGDSSTPYTWALEFGHNAGGNGGTHVPPVKFFGPVVRIIRKKHRSAMRRAIRKALKVVFP